MKRGKSERKRLLGGVLRLLFVMIMLATVIVTVGGIAVHAMFERTLPDHFFSLTVKGIAPRFYAYAFDDRTNRVGEAYLLSEDFYLQRGSIYVPYEALPAHLKGAFIAIEDKRFYEHRGVDWYRTASAGANYLLGFSKSFGASTVTQQLVKNLTGNSEVTLRRKLQEMLYAIDLERRLDKSEIMELYVNVIHFAEQCNGIGAAAEHYFSKKAEDLTVSESATLAAIINNPSYYNPIRHPENNLRRRNLILSEMHEQNMLSDAEYEAARAAPLGLNVKEYKGNGISSWYADMVIEDVIHDLCAEHGMSRSAAESLVRAGGLHIETAMDEEAQKTVERYYRSLTLPKNKDGESAQSALILIDHHTGDILGVAGAVGEKRGTRIQSYATQTLRPPGSAIKPITVYAPALEEGLIRWSSVFDDTPTKFNADGQGVWPHNASGGYRGLTTVADAVANSTNTVAVKILQKVGLRKAFSIAKQQFGIQSLYEDRDISDCGEAALALGQMHYGVTLRELATAYTPFASNGSYRASRSYYRVLDAEGNVLLSRPDRAEIVMSAANAAVMTKLMQGVVEHGTAASVKLKSRVECAGKTGSTNHDCDRWFVGYTPEWICGVWCGYAYPEPLTGRNACLGIWDDVMHALLPLHKGEHRFEVPASLVRVSYCRDSGKRPGEACGYDARDDRIEEGWFVRGTEPQALCDCHVLCLYDAEGGGVSHGFCPQEACRRVALLRIDRDLPREITVADAQYAYDGDPFNHVPNPNESQSYFAPYARAIYGKSAVRAPFNRSCPYHTGPPAPSHDPAEEDAEEEGA